MEKSEKRKRFEKVASNRVQRILDTLDLLQNCSNSNNYEYNERDVEHMFNEITKKLKETSLVFSQEIKKDNKQGFNF